MKGDRLRDCSKRLLLAAGKLFCLMHFEELSSEDFKAVLDLFSVPAENRKLMKKTKGEKIIGKQKDRTVIYEETFRNLLCIFKRTLLEVEEETVYTEEKAQLVMDDSKQLEEIEALRALNTLLSSYVQKMPGV